MKVAPHILKAILLTVTVGTFVGSCKKNDVNSGKEEIKNPKENKKPEPCPGCGMG